MEFIFLDSMPKALEEYKNVLKPKHYVKVDYIKETIEARGFNKVPKTLITHLWNDVYELRPLDGRVIFLLYDDDKAIILGAYLKRSQKIPKKIQDTIKNREKIAIAELKGE